MHIDKTASYLESPNRFPYALMGGGDTLDYSSYSIYSCATPVEFLLWTREASLH